MNIGRKVVVSVALTAMAVGAANGMLLSMSRNRYKNNATTAAETTSGPYRDGLFEGGLDARRCNMPHISAGRWNSISDREAFAAGYQRGFTTNDSKCVDFSDSPW
jgi:hypothetical protein